MQLIHDFKSALRFLMGKILFMAKTKYNLTTEFSGKTPIALRGFESGPTV